MFCVFCAAFQCVLSGMPVSALAGRPVAPAKSLQHRSSLEKVLFAGLAPASFDMRMFYMIASVASVLRWVWTSEAAA